MTGATTIKGYAIVFDKTILFGNRYERVERGAFSAMLSGRMPEIKILWGSHDVGAPVLASTRAGSAQFFEDDYGLGFSFQLSLSRGCIPWQVSEIVKRKDPKDRCSVSIINQETSTEKIYGNSEFLRIKVATIDHVTVGIERGAYMDTATWATHCTLSQAPTRIQELAARWEIGNAAARRRTSQPRNFVKVEKKLSNVIPFNARLKNRPLRSISALKAIGFEARAVGDSGEIYLYGDIGEGPLSAGVTANEFRQQLTVLKGVKNIDLHIDSDGGDVFAAEVMYALLRSHGATITTHIDGHAASAASFLAMAGDKIKIAEPAFLMIHNAHGVVVGRANEMRRYADLIDRVSGKIAGIYAARTGQPLDKIQSWMKADNGAGTWFDADEAIKFGFASEIVQNLRVAAKVRHPDWFPTLPAALRPNLSRARAMVAQMKVRATLRRVK